MTIETKEVVSAGELEPKMSFFATTVHLLAQGKLKDFASRWDNTTGYTMKQLADLYLYEWGRSFGPLRLNAAIFMFIAVTGVLAFIGSAIFTLGQGFWPYLCTSLSLIYLVGGFVSAFYLMTRLQARRYNASRGPQYEAELRRFSDALEAALTALGWTHDDALKLGVERTARKAGEKLDEMANTIYQADGELDAASTLEQFRLHGMTLMDLRERFGETHAAFARAKLEKRTYGTILDDAKKRKQGSKSRSVGVELA